MAWIYLLLAAFCEIAMGVSLKLNEGWTRLFSSIAAIVSWLLSSYLLALSLRALPVGMAYAIWNGIGAIGLVITSALMFQESIGPFRLACISLVLVGLVGLRFSE
ncbi:DMT family transporter [Herbaspirillum robiniae]|uniref:Guanidinium exporter n=1 Tax=Herbaspirillum robiniae TaxID=2014887 RepID=A0ABX2M4Q6_9BURK|nr:SMR family transporter [Herbaspirillum robiniae]NUU02711.1 QacE family quaternary ammonium compound efflux SMR transporter [Herbaspirillum robiniae]